MWFFQCALVATMTLLLDRRLARQLDDDPLEEPSKSVVESFQRSARLVVAAMFLAGGVFWALTAAGYSATVAAVGLVVVCLAPMPLIIRSLMKISAASAASGA